MLGQALQAVRVFRESLGLSNFNFDAPVSQPFIDYIAKIRDMMQGFAAEVDLELRLQERRIDNSAHQYSKDELRILCDFQLVVEEAAELIDAYLTDNKVEFLDAMSDLVYVVFGLAVASGFPLREGFNVVHESNMTKQNMQPEAYVNRLRDKGPGFVSPTEKLTKLIQTIYGEKDAIQ